MRVKIIDVQVEVKKPGAKGWSLANVKFMNENGETKFQNVASFKAPAVFKSLPNFIGEEVDVTTVKNDKGYDEWNTVAPASGAPAATSTPASTPTTRVTGSNYETPVERARRQVLIVRQSSLSNAVEVLGPGKDVGDYTDLAQEFVDWVFDEGKEESDDIPY